jgi:signal transduction histidine kinase
VRVRGWRSVWSLRAKGLFIISVPLVFEVAFMVAMGFIDNVARRQQAAEVRVQEITAASYRLMSLLVDAETGIRGYVITEQPGFAEPYDRAVAEVPRQLAHLRAIAPALSREITEVSVRASAVLAYETMEHFRVRTGHRDEAATIVQSGRGKQLMDTTRGAVDRLLQRETTLADDARRAHDRTRRNLRALLLGGLAVNLAAAAAMAWLFSAGIARRLGTVIDNTYRLEHDEALLPHVDGADEIAELDARFHEMAAALEQNRRALELSNRELDAFSYSVSHDLRSPLRAVNGYARMIEEDFADRLNAEGRRYLGSIRGEARRMGQLIDDLLAFSRLGRNPLQLSTVDVAALAREVLPTVVSADVRIAVEIADVPYACADRGLLRQVLVNLFSNAVKFSARNPDARITLEGTLGERENVYWLRDNGVGFDMRYVDKLFGVFQRLHSGSDFEGTGVGLAIVQRVVHRHGGRVWAESEEGKGACFYFTLPAPEENA